MLAQLLGAELSDPARAGTIVKNVQPLDRAGPHDLAFLWDPKYTEAARASGAAAVVCREVLPGMRAPALVVADPQEAMLTLLGLVYAEQRPPLPAGVHPTAFVHPEAQLGEGVAVGPLAVVEARAVLGPRTQVRAQAYVGRGVRTGADCVLHPQAAVLDHCVLGDRVVIWTGAIVGKDGFGYLQRGGRHVRIPQVGAVRMGDDVEVGALSTVARGALDDTRLGPGVKIDDHCHVAHNCQLGENTMLIGCSSMAGSAKTGRDVYLLQGSGLGVGISAGDGAVLGSDTNAFYEDVPAGAKVLGSPARPHVTQKRIEIALPRLPELLRRVRALEKRVGIDGRGTGE
jgi:UDP-3-O-[3-hydroxymyristoyl] glucosamine N-acyltransferase